MELYPYFLSLIEQDRAHIVICDTEHTILHMNPAADKRYEKYGGHKLVGKSLLSCHNEQSRRMINKVVDWFKKDVNNNLVHTYYHPKENRDVYMVALRDTDGKLIGYYEKHEFRNRETMGLYSMGE